MYQRKTGWCLGLYIHSFLCLSLKVCEGLIMGVCDGNAGTAMQLWWRTLREDGEILSSTKFGLFSGLGFKKISQVELVVVSNLDKN